MEHPWRFGAQSAFRTRSRSAHAGDPFDELQQALGAHGVGAKSVVTADGEYGQALFSRWPLVHREIHDLSFPEREPRRAICADVDTPGGVLRVIATHLGLSLREQCSQAIALLNMLGQLDRPTVAMGDFNDWFWAGSVRRGLERALPGVSRHRTFPACVPIFQLDRVYVAPASAWIGSRTDHAARHVSDDLPVIAEIAL